MKLRLFQCQDLARAGLHDGLILSWDTGLGKSWAGYAWPLLKVGYDKVIEDGQVRIKPKAPVLIIAPGDLHQQMCDEGLKHFKIKVMPLPDQETFTRLTRKPGSLTPNLTAEGRPTLARDFYITSYTQLATNGVQSLPDPEDWPDPVALLKFLCLPVGSHVPTVSQGDTIQEVQVWNWNDRPSFKTVAEFLAWRGLRWNSEYNLLGLHPDDCLEDLERAYRREVEALQCMRDQKLAARMLAKLQGARDILANLYTDKPVPKFSGLSKRQQDFVVREFCCIKVEEYGANNGCFKPQDLQQRSINELDNPTEEERRAFLEEEAKHKFARIKCLYSPSLADLCYNAFDCVVIDEGVKMKGEDTFVGKGVRSMEPKYRLVLTATPVKNRLPDIFRLAWWAAGGLPEAHARWPYADDSSERTKFAETFMVSEHNLTKEKKAEAMAAAGLGPEPSRSRFKKLTAEVCNVHRLWKLLGPIVLRRRKQDAGEEIVPRIRKVIRCDMGTLQQQVYRYHLQADYRDKNGEPAIGAQLQALRMAAADPSSEHLVTQPGHNSRTCPVCRGNKSSVSCALEHPNQSSEALIATGPPCPKCKGTGEIPLPHRSGSAFIPKMATTLTLVQEILARQEQVVVFSAFNDPLDNLGQWLHEAGVRYVKLDGRTSQKQRGKLAAQFKRGRARVQEEETNPIPVMLAGVECMAEGHSFHLANNVILICYSWAFDKFKQALDRVHRMTSTKPVNVYVVLCSGTIDRKLESLIQDKSDAAELVLDGRLIGECTEEVNLAELLTVAHKEFADDKTQTIDEAELQTQWKSTLRAQLQQAMANWDASCVTPVGLQLRRAADFTELKKRLSSVQTSALVAQKRSENVAKPVLTSQPEWRTRMAKRAKKLADLAKPNLT